MSVFVIINPAAGRGRREGRIAGLRELLDRAIPDRREIFTTGPGQEAALVDQALAEGCDTIVAIGGDGTWSLVADRILGSGRHDVRLGLLPAGTGNDFGKSVGITFDRAERVVRAIAERRARRVDVGRAGGRHFLNVVGAGFDIAVIDDVVGLPLLRGDALYRVCALRQLFRFPGLPLEIHANSDRPLVLDHLMLVVANANYFGGSFHIAPHARLDDGRLDAVSIANGSAFERARLFSLVGRGRHEGHPKVVIKQASRLEVHSEPGWRYEMDGEVYTCEGGRLEIVSVPAALEICAPEL